MADGEQILSCPHSFLFPKSLTITGRVDGHPYTYLDIEKHEGVLSMD